MKNILNNAMNELMVRVNNEVEEVRAIIKTDDTKGNKLNALIERRDIIFNLLEKVETIKDNLKLNFPEDLEEVERVTKEELKVKVQLEDMLDIINEAGFIPMDEILYGDIEDELEVM